MNAEQGARLREYLRVATGGQHGWVTALAEAAGVRRATVYAWFEGKSSPSLDSLEGLVSVTGRSRAQIVAAMDGEADPTQPHTLVEVTERLFELEAAVELLASQDLAARGSAVPPAPAARRRSAE
jgi:transcriptional regulator with XRE-family HTH domain